MQQDMSLTFFQDHTLIPIKQSMNHNSNRTINESQFNKSINQSMSRVIPISPGTPSTEGETLHFIEQVTVNNT